MIAVTAAVRGPIHPSQLNYPDGGATLDGGIKRPIRVNSFHTKLVELMPSFVIAVTAICSAAPYDVVCFPLGCGALPGGLRNRRNRVQVLFRLMCGSGFSQKSRGSVSSNDRSQMETAKIARTGIGYQSQIKDRR